MMKLQQLLEQASWRLRGYLGAPSTDERLVGWRRDGCACPVAEWLLFEAEERGGLPEVSVYSVDHEYIAWGSEIASTPLALVSFIDIIDRQHRMFWQDNASRVSREEASAALLEAERWMAQRLLPARAESLPRCEYAGKDGHRCGQVAITPVIYGFLDQSAQPLAKPQRASCRLFLGRLCEEHWRRAVIPPSTWWPKPSDAGREAGEVMVEVAR